MKRYRINEVFYSPQGEGVRAGTMNVFVRFTGCNMQCAQEPGPKSPGGFDCDTEFESGKWQTLDELAVWCGMEIGGATGVAFADGIRACDQWPEPWLILTGGEPGLQVDAGLCDYFHARGVKLAIETNGSIALPTRAIPDGLGVKLWPRLELSYLDWITVSPKVAEHAIRQTVAHEVKYVRGYGQEIPKTSVEAVNKLISPAFNGLIVEPRVVDWCVDLCRRNPTWRLSPQLHKLWKAR